VGICLSATAVNISMAAPGVETMAVEAKAVGEVSCNTPIVVDEAERLRVQELLR
jgi:hypothetical protein